MLSNQDHAHISVTQAVEMRRSLFASTRIIRPDHVSRLPRVDVQRHHGHARPPNKLQLHVIGLKAKQDEPIHQRPLNGASDRAPDRRHDHDGHALCIAHVTKAA